MEHYRLLCSGVPHVYVDRDLTPFGWTAYACWSADAGDTEVRFAWTRKRAVAKGERVVRERLAAPQPPRDFVVEVTP